LVWFFAFVGVPFEQKNTAQRLATTIPKKEDQHGHKNTKSNKKPYFGAVALQQNTCLELRQKNL
jgi:hypothetical protein